MRTQVLGGFKRQVTEKGGLIVLISSGPTGLTQSKGFEFLWGPTLMGQEILGWPYFE